MVYALKYIDNILDAFRDKITIIRKELDGEWGYKNRNVSDDISRGYQNKIWRKFRRSKFDLEEIIGNKKETVQTETKQRFITLDMGKKTAIQTYDDSNLEQKITSKPHESRVEKVTTIDLLDLFMTGFPSYINAREAELKRYFHERIKTLPKNLIKSGVEYKLKLTIQASNGVVKAIEYASDKIIEEIEKFRLEKNPTYKNREKEEIYFISESETDEFLAIKKEDIANKLNDIDPTLVDFTVLKSENIAFSKKNYHNNSKKPQFMIIAQVKRSIRELEKVADYISWIREELQSDSIRTLEVMPTEYIIESARGIWEISNHTNYNIEIKPSTKQIANLIKTKPYLNQDAIWQHVQKNHFVVSDILDKKLGEFKKEYRMINDQAVQNAKRYHNKEYASEEEREVLKKFSLPGIWIDRSPVNEPAIRQEVILVDHDQYDIYTLAMPHDTKHVAERAEKRDKQHKENHTHYLAEKLVKMFEPAFPATYKIKKFVI